MTSRQHALWNGRGKPAQLARPLRALRDRLRAAGYTVYDIGNDEHLDHQPPEDHTPYSETGWPDESPYGWLMAIDVMPPAAGSGLPSLQTLGARLVADRKSGVAPWLKYLNWGPVSDRAAVQDRWMPTYGRRASSDRGHIHASIRTDFYLSTDFDDYDPLSIGGAAAMTGPLEQNTERAVTAFYTGQDPVEFPAPWGPAPGVGSAADPLPNPFVRLESKVDKLLKLVDELAKRPAIDVLQEQVDAAVAAALSDVRLETRFTSPPDGP